MSQDDSNLPPCLRPTRIFRVPVPKWSDMPEEGQGLSVLHNVDVRTKYLDNICQLGSRSLAANYIGIDSAEVTKFLRNSDPEGHFQRQIEIALEIRASYLVSTIECQALTGHEVVTYDREGRETVNIKYETPIRLRMLERYDEAYSPKSTVKLEGKSGVLAVPMVASSIEEWEQSVTDSIKGGQ